MSENETGIAFLEILNNVLHYSCLNRPYQFQPAIASRKTCVITKSKASLAECTSVLENSTGSLSNQLEVTQMEEPFFIDFVTYLFAQTGRCSN